MRIRTSSSVLAGFTLLALTIPASAAEGPELQALKKAVAAAKVGLTEAIETAQKAVPGGKVIEAGLEVEQDQTFYEVIVLSGDAVKEVKVDAAAGKVLGIKDEQPEADEEKELAEARQALAAAKVNFAQALSSAGKEVPDGKPFKFELELKDGKPTYEVVLLAGDKVMKVALDAVTGKVAKVAEKKPAAPRDESAEARQALAAAKVTLAQALEAAGKAVKDGKAIAVEIEMEDTTPTYSVLFAQGDKLIEANVDAVSGKAGPPEEEKPEGAAAREFAEAKQALAAAKITLAQAVETAAQKVKDGKVFAAELGLEDGKPAFEVQLLQGDARIEAHIDAVSGSLLKAAAEKVAANGKAAREEQDEDEADEDHPAGKSAGSADFRQDFKVDKVNWADHGTNPYFVLEPGYAWRFKHGDATLTITVLKDTKMVDGVSTRVVEEREAKNGQLLEVSRNYFALDKSTGDLYYFGEDVDDYENGKVAGHGGAWLSGVNNARFGLFLPGTPKVGDKFCQEVAPHVAMDRAEIVGLAEKIETPAGTYEKCLHVKETTPLEKGVSHKLYAPGVGPVRDDEFVLEAIIKPQ
jgi:uncharacterized membrane protein YkoI